MEEVRREVQTQGNVGTKLNNLETKLATLEGSIVSAGESTA